MRRFALIPWLLATCLLLLLPAAAQADPPPEHQYIQEYEGAQTCEICHLGITEDVAHSVHYTWSEKMNHYSPIPASVASINWLDVLNPDMEIAGGCGRCHIGGGPMPGTAAADTPAAHEQIDCLVCHAEVYDMKARYPVLDEEGNWTIPGDHSLAAARSAARPSDEACLRCHLNAGGGELLKRGVDFAPVADRHAASSYGDVHAEQGMVCVDCHQAPDHKFYGFAPTIWSRDREDERLTCTACHNEEPHDNALINQHQRLDCRTCHAPSTGGLVKRDYTVEPIYNPITELYEPVDEVAPTNELIPSYLWFNGDRFTPQHGWPGDHEDPNAKIQPFKVYEGTVPVNPQNGQPWPLDLDVFYKTGDLTQAMQAGAEAVGMEWTGEWEAKTMKVPLQVSHGIVAAERALTCPDCHVPDGRMDFAALDYSDDRVAVLESISSSDTNSPQSLQVKFSPNTEPLLETNSENDITVESGVKLPLVNSWSLLGVLLILFVIAVIAGYALIHLRRQMSR